MSMKNAFLYARVSSAEQATNNSLGSQIAKCEKYAEAHEYQIVDRFVDAGFSAESMNRPEMNRLLAEVAKQEVTAVLYFDEDRWARGYDGPDVRRKLRVSGVRCVNVSTCRGDSADYLAEEESEELSAVTARAFVRNLQQKTPTRMRDAVVAGKKGIGGVPPFGYVFAWVDERTRETKIVPDPVTAPLVLRAFELYADGGSTRDVAAFLVLKPYNVTRLLRNPRYTGANVVGKTSKRKRGGIIKTTYLPASTWAKREGAHEPIVPRELFDRVQVRLEAVSAGKTRTRSQNDANPFPQGLLRCAQCGSVVELHKAATTYTFMCRRRRDLGAVRGDAACSGAVRVEYVTKEVLARVGYLLQGDRLRDALASYTPKTNPEIDRLENSLTKARSSSENLLRQIENARTPAAGDVYAARFDKTLADIKDTEHRLRALRAVESPRIDPAKIATDAWSIKNALAAMDIPTLRATLRSVFSSIRIDFAKGGALRDAFRTLEATKLRKPTAQVAEAKRRAAETVDSILWTSGPGPVQFVHTWEARGGTLTDETLTTVAKELAS